MTRLSQRSQDGPGLTAGQVYPMEAKAGPPTLPAWAERPRAREESSR